MNAAHRLADGFRAVVSYWTPIPTTSQFVDKGTLTPQEFVEAGDQLAFKFPTWRWQRADSRRLVSWLPPNKQYLITYGVACRSRLRDLDASIAQSTSVPIDPASESSWYLSYCEDEHLEEAQTNRSSTSSSTPLRQPQQPPSTKGATLVSPVLPSRAEVLCFDDVDEMLETDDDVVARTEDVDHHGDVCVIKSNGGKSDFSTLKTRSYDLSVTYDKYYQTPRLWLKGYDEQGIPLDAHQIFEDILTDYVSKTVTIDPHPCTGELTVSIHPCRHAAMMKRVVDGWITHNIKPRHDLALVVLLKFISSVIPTIQYDTTLDIDGFDTSCSSSSSSSSSSKKK